MKSRAGMIETSRPDEIERLKAEIKALEEEHRQLEKNLPAHGVKVDHLQRIEALEDIIALNKERLARLNRD